MDCLTAGGGSVLTGIFEETGTWVLATAGTGARCSGSWPFGFSFCFLFMYSASDICDSVNHRTQWNVEHPTVDIERTATSSTANSKKVHKIHAKRNNILMQQHICSSAYEMTANVYTIPTVYNVPTDNHAPKPVAGRSIDRVHTHVGHSIAFN